MTAGRSGPRRLGCGLTITTLLAVGLPAHGGEVNTSRPLALHAGASRGPAVALHVNAQRTRRAVALPDPEAAKIAWRRQVPGGVTCNVLVDAAGRIFTAGLSRVTQLGPDGRIEFTEAASFNAAAVATLRADGARVVLTRDGRVLGWSESGAPLFDVALDTPQSTQSTLLPLPDGGLLVSAGPWLLELDVQQRVRRHASLPAPVEQTLLAGERLIAVDERGGVFEWSRSWSPRSVGALPGPAGSVLADAGVLLALASKRTLQRLDLASGALSEVVRFDAGSAALLALQEPSRWLVLRSDGSWLVAEPGTKTSPPASSASGVAQPDALTDPSGVVAWWSANTSLHLETAPGVGRELPEIRCAIPASLVPAGSSRLVAACGTGLIWLIGPASAPDAASTPPPADGRRAVPAEIVGG